MTELAVIVCNNGLGHARRVLSLLELFYKRNGAKIRVNIFVDAAKISYFPSALAFFRKNKCKVRFFDIRARYEGYEKEFISKYKQHLETSDFIWSDNLIFPLKYKKEFFLTGSFLWPDAVDNQYSRHEEGILKGNFPVMIGNKYFAMPKAKSLTEFIGVGMYEYFSFYLPKRPVQGLLLGCGATDSGRRYFARFIPRLVKRLKGLSAAVDIYIEPFFYKEFKACKNVKLAEYLEPMFSKISASCIRPGFGSINDTLLKGSKVFAFFENGNSELLHNARVLEHLGVGKTCRNPLDSLNQALDYILDLKAAHAQFSNLKKLEFSGLSQTVSKIKEIIN